MSKRSSGKPTDEAVARPHFRETGQPSPEAAQCREGAPWGRQLLVLAVLLCIVAGLLHIIDGTRSWVLHRAEVLITVAGIAFWRWGWFLIQNVRAVIYRYFVFPRLRRAAQKAVAEQGPVPEVTVLATTYHEKPWITAPVFESIFRELSTLEGLHRKPKVVVVTGCDGDDESVRQVYSRCCETAAMSAKEMWPPELVLLRGDKGKRPALALGMEEIARGNPREDGVVIILDGDTMMGPDLFAKVLPVFRLSPPVSGVTTNENNLVTASSLRPNFTSLSATEIRLSQSLSV